MSKKSNQKTAEPKTEAVEGIIETKAEEVTGQEQADAPSEQVGENPANESADPKTATAEELAGDHATPASSSENPAAKDEGTSPLITEIGTPGLHALLVGDHPQSTPTDLANRLTQTVKAIVVTGAPEAVHALHKLEMAVGDLKNALPAAIAAAGDGQLKADLTSLLAIL